MEEFGPLDWYRGKTVEEMRNDLVTLAKGQYFDDDKEYAFMASGELVIRSGEELNDQTPEGPGPEEFMQMDDEDIVSSYISNIKMYPEYADIKNQEGFAEAFLPALENMNNVAQRFTTGTGSRDNPIGSKLEYGDGMTIATEIYTGAITDYIATGFRNKEEFFKWYLSDVAHLQVVMQPGQVQAEDFSVVDKLSAAPNENECGLPISCLLTLYPNTVISTGDKWNIDVSTYSLNSLDKDIILSLLETKVDITDCIASNFSSLEISWFVTDNTVCIKFKSDDTKLLVFTIWFIWLKKSSFGFLSKLAATYTFAMFPYLLGKFNTLAS